LNFDSSNYDQYFLETIADVLTGSSPRYWDNKGYPKFEFALKSVKTEIELVCEISHPSFKGQSVLAFIDKGKKQKTFMKLGSLSAIDKHLNKPIEEMKLILNTLDEMDKRKALLSILECIDEDHTSDQATLKGEPDIHA